MAEKHLVLFEDVTNGTGLFRALSQRGFECKVSFSPPDIEKICGIAIEYNHKEDQEKIQIVADELGFKIKDFIDYQEG